MTTQNPDERNRMTAPNLPVGTRLCSSCGTIGYQGDRYCPCCGTAMIRMCPHCGVAVVHPIAYFCTDCGGTLDEKGRKERGEIQETHRKHRATGTGARDTVRGNACRCSGPSSND